MKSEEFWKLQIRFSHSLGKALGVPVRVHYGVYLTLLLFVAYGLVRNMVYSRLRSDLWEELLFLFFLITVFASIVVHELGHTAVAILLKRRVHGIVIYPFLGATVYNHSRNMSARNDVLVSVAGPVTNLALAGILSYFGNSDFLKAVAAANFWLGSLNLLPLWPLDGGRILKSILSLKGWNHMRISRVMWASSRISGLGMGITAFRNDDYIMFIFTVLLLSAAQIEFSSSQ